MVYSAIALYLAFVVLVWLMLRKIDRLHKELVQVRALRERAIDERNEAEKRVHSMHNQLREHRQQCEQLEKRLVMQDERIELAINNLHGRKVN